MRFCRVEEVASLGPHRTPLVSSPLLHFSAQNPRAESTQGRESSEPALPPASSVTDDRLDLRLVLTLRVIVVFLTSKKALTNLSHP